MKILETVVWPGGGKSGRRKAFSEMRQGPSSCSEQHSKHRPSTAQPTHLALLGGLQTTLLDKQESLPFQESHLLIAQIQVESSEMREGDRKSHIRGPTFSHSRTERPCLLLGRSRKTHPKTPAQSRPLALVTPAWLLEQFSGLHLER